MLDEGVIEGARLAMVGGSYPAGMAITVRRRVAGGWEILSGHHRVEAARREGLSDVVGVVAKLSDVEAAIHIAAANNHAPMTPIDYGRHFILMKTHFKTTAAAYGEAIGKTESWVSDCKKAAECADSMQEDRTLYESLPFTVLADAQRIRDLPQRKALLDALVASSRPTVLVRATLARMREGEPMEAAIKQARALPETSEAHKSFVARGDYARYQASSEETGPDGTRARPDLAARANRSDYLNDCLSGLALMLDIRAEMEAKRKPDMGDPRQARAFVDAVYSRVRMTRAAEVASDQQQGAA